jgi:hypothetical protein
MSTGSVAPVVRLLVVVFPRLLMLRPYSSMDGQVLLDAL